MTEPMMAELTQAQAATEPLLLIDTHVHLNFEGLQENLDNVAHNWRQAGVARLVHSCVEPSEFAGIQAIANRFPEISFAVGLHPLDADKWTSDSAQQILELAQSDQRVVAIGEMGLDFFKAENRDRQIAVFIAQLEIAHQLDLPVIIHCRDAAVEMAEIMRSFWQSRGAVQGVMHCWSGTSEETQWFLDLGMYVSFSGIVTFKSAVQVQASAQKVPSDRLLIETDCPFLSPVPKRGERPNQPAYVYYVAQQMAHLRQVTLETLASQTTANACRLFKLSLPLEPVGAVRPGVVNTNG
ncbi:MAG TPA: TatD family hydrolase [Coleofasciculaceae cyanobacterium]|jgi:TatD DNase family protein